MQFHCNSRGATFVLIKATRDTMQNLNEFHPMLSDLAPRVKEKALELAAALLSEGRFTQPDEALREGIKQAEEWFLDLEG